jgi:hypothetical protein
MKRSLVRWFVRSTLQMMVLSYSQGILANDFMEYSDVSAEQVTYETKANNDKHEAYHDPQFHNDSYLQTVMSEDTVASSDF